MKKRLLPILVLCLILAGCGKDKPEETTLPELKAEIVEVPVEMEFTEVHEDVTAKEQTNLRNIPSQGDDSIVLYTLKNGEIAKRVGISDTGWSKVIFDGNTFYAVSSYLTTDMNYAPPTQPEQSSDDDGIHTQFTPVSETVTAKDVVNLRTLPSTTHPDAQVIGQLKHGVTAERIGISESGWSKLKYKGELCYAVSSYLTTDLKNDGSKKESEANQDPDGDGIKTSFTPTNDRVTAKIEVNLRTLPSVTDKQAKVVVTLKNGTPVTRTGMNVEMGWSRVEYEGQTLYCVSSYLIPYVDPEPQAEEVPTEEAETEDAGG